jgi:hypothetical protein
MKTPEWAFGFAMLDYTEGMQDASIMNFRNSTPPAGT